MHARSNKTGFGLLTIAALASLLIVEPAHAQGTLYYQASNFFVYKEERSCTLYVDFASGTTIRISNRVDESRAYFSALNTDWALLQAREGETLMVSLRFAGTRIQHGSAGIIVRDPAGRMGYAASNLGNTGVFDDFARSSELTLLVYSDGTPVTEVERFPLAGSGIAVQQLRQCTRQYFRADGSPLPAAELTPSPTQNPRTVDGNTRNGMPAAEGRAAYNAYRTCVRAAAARFARSREAAPVVARSALTSCGVQRAALSRLLAANYNYRLARRMMERFDDDARAQAELRVIELRSR